jgi:hypothetical protein
MEFLKRTFLEDPTYLYVLLVIVELVLMAIWYSRRTAWSARLLLLPVVLAGCVVAADAMVVTDRERLKQVVEEIAADVAGGSFDVATSYLDDSYQGFGGNKAGLIDRGLAEAHSRRIEKVKFTRVQTIFSGKTAEMDVTTVIHMRGDYAGSRPIAWKIYWVDLPEGWRIRGVTSPQLVIPGFER